MEIFKFLEWIKDPFYFCKGINPTLCGILGPVSVEGNKIAHLPRIMPNSVTGHNFGVNRVGNVIIIAHAK